MGEHSPSNQGRWKMAAEVKKRCIAVFGGSGLLGRELVSAALSKGLCVKALYRPGSESRKEEGLEIITGKLKEASDIRRTLEGTVGAICVYGPRLSRGNDPEPFTADATSRIIEEMKALSLNRLIVQTGAMAGGDSPSWSWFVRRFVRSYRKDFPKSSKDRDAQEDVTRNSGLDWTITRTFRISGGGGSGRLRALENVRIGFFTHTPRRDFADFLVNELLEGTHHKKTIYVIK